jgi:hypothetical protein
MSSTFTLEKEQFGVLVNDCSWIKKSLNLTEDEYLILVKVTPSLTGRLIVFILCIWWVFDRKIAESDEEFATDSNAFIYSLRRNGVLDFQKFSIMEKKYAIFGNATYGPTFGGGHDIC